MVHIQYIIILVIHLKAAQEMFNLLRDLFETVLEMGNNGGNLREEKNKVASEELKQEFDSSDKARLISGNEPEVTSEKTELKPQVVAPVEPAKPQVVAPVEPAKPVIVVEASLFDLSSDVVEPVKPVSAMDDLFGLGDLSLDSSHANNSQTTSPFGNIFFIFFCVLI